MIAGASDSDGGPASSTHATAVSGGAGADIGELLQVLDVDAARGCGG
jgi:hypothetical protein